jgi:hypothetical protein
MSSFRVCWLPSPIKQVSGLSRGPGAGSRLWIFDRGLGRLVPLRCLKMWSWKLIAQSLPGTTPKTYILIGIGRCRSKVPKPPPTLVPVVGSHLGARWNHADRGG